MYLLDTDTISNFVDPERSHDLLRRRILDISPADLYTSEVNLDEVLGGQAAKINTLLGKQDEVKLVRAYRFYRLLFDALKELQVVPYDELAVACFKRVDAKVRRRHGPDSRIAACAAAHDLIVVTCNPRHFEEIGLGPYEDWTRGPLEE